MAPRRRFQRVGAGGLHALPIWAEQPVVRDNRVDADGDPDSGGDSKPVQTSDLNTWYADLTLRHEVTRSISYGLSVGHEVQAGFLSDAVEDSYVRYLVGLEDHQDLNLNSYFCMSMANRGWAT